jgi:hypothetical protein
LNQLMMKPKSYRIIYITIVIIFIALKSLHAQDDWHFMDESASRLPDTTTLADDLDGGDINGSGAISILVGQSRNIVHNLPGVAQLFINSGLGYFSLADSSTFPQRNDESSYVMLLDVDGDSDLDAFVVNYNYLTDYIAIYNGNGIFQIDWARLPQDSAVALEGDYADIEGDGDIDVCLLGNNTIRFSHRLWINDGSGYFHDEINRMPYLYSYYYYIGFADINGDLAPDILAVHLDNVESYPTVLINDGSGNFHDESEYRLPQTETFSRTAALVDIDNDGDFDIVLAYSERLGFLINDGNGYFVDETEARGPIYEIAPYEIQSFDADNDGDRDLILGTAGIHADRIFINDGEGYFNDETSLRWPNQENSTLSMFLGDLDSDGDDDIFRVGDSYCRNSVFINTLNVPDSVSPRIMNQTIFSQIDTAGGPYPVRLISQDGIAIPTQLSAYVFYSLDGRSYNGVFMHYTGAYTYYAEIPAIDSGQTVLYYYSITDKWQNTSYSPPNASDSVFSLTYLPGYSATEEDIDELPRYLSLRAYPNPFNSKITIEINNMKYGNGPIEIYDITGKLIKQIDLDNKKEVVTRRIVWDGSTESGTAAPSGVYFIRIRSLHQWKSISVIMAK